MDGGISYSQFALSRFAEAELFGRSGGPRGALHHLGLLHQGRLGFDHFLGLRVHQLFPVKQSPFGIRRGLKAGVAA